MITDAFLEANNTLRIAESISDPSDFLTMTDTLVPIIERSKEPSLAGAREIIGRLRRRRLYRFVDEFLLPAGATCKITPEEITTSQDSAGTGIDLRPDDIHVAHVTLNFGKKSKNPVDHVLFFKDWDDQSPRHISSSKVSYVIPAHFEEKIIRVYLKREFGHDSERAKKAVKLAFRRFIERMKPASPIASPVVGSKRHRGNGPDDILAPLDDDGVDSSDTQPSPTARGALASTMDERLSKRVRPQLGFLEKQDHQHETL